jgi:hypothetical protein
MIFLHLAACRALSSQFASADAFSRPAVAPLSTFKPLSHRPVRISACEEYAGEELVRRHGDTLDGVFCGSRVSSGTIGIRSSTFHYCLKRSGDGGVLELKGVDCIFSIEQSIAADCTASRGAFGVVHLGSGKPGTIKECRFERCSPGRRPASRDCISLAADWITVTGVNFTENQLMGSGCALSVGDPITAGPAPSVAQWTIRWVVASECFGGGILDLVGPARRQDLDRVHIIRSGATNWLIEIDGDIRAINCCFFWVAGALVHSRQGVVLFDRCMFDSGYQIGPYAQFTACGVGIEAPEKVTLYTDIQLDLIPLEGSPRFLDESGLQIEPRTPPMSPSEVVGYGLSFWLSFSGSLAAIGVLFVVLSSAS